MQPVWIIAKRELASFFDSLVAYILIVLFLLFTGLFTWLYGSDIFLNKQASLQVFFGVAWWTLLVFIPAITMKTLAEERRSGTLELLLTKSVTNGQVVLGKYLACLLLVAITLLFTLPYYVTVASLGNMDHGATLTGYLGLLLMSSAYIGIGLFTSSLTSNQIVAFLLGLFICVLFHFVFGFIAANFTGLSGEIFLSLSVQQHFESIARGVIDSRDLVFFLSVTAAGVVLSIQMISNRK